MELISGCCDRFRIVPICHQFSGLHMIFHMSSNLSRLQIHSLCCPEHGLHNSLYLTICHCLTNVFKWCIAVSWSVFHWWLLRAVETKQKYIRNGIVSLFALLHRVVVFWYMYKVIQFWITGTCIKSPNLINCSYHCCLCLWAYYNFEVSKTVECNAESHDYIKSAHFSTD